jgi:hypothetical protein
MCSVSRTCLSTTHRPKRQIKPRAVRRPNLYHCISHQSHDQSLKRPEHRTCATHTRNWFTNEMMSWPWTLRPFFRPLHPPRMLHWHLLGVTRRQLCSRHPPLCPLGSQPLEGHHSFHSTTPTCPPALLGSPRVSHQRPLLLGLHRLSTT